MWLKIKLNKTINRLIFTIRINDFNHNKLQLTIKPKRVYRKAGPYLKIYFYIGWIQERPNNFISGRLLQKGQIWPLKRQPLSPSYEIFLDRTDLPWLCRVRGLALKTPGVNFIKILWAAFTHADPKCAKKDSEVSSVVWCFWDQRS